MKLYTLISGFVIAFLGFTLSFSYIQAAEPYSTTIQSISENGKITMSPGERKEVLVEFLNTGSQTWKNDGPGYISAYTYGPKYRRSVFDPATWLWGDKLSRISEPVVAPGELATMRFEIHAPQEVGEYAETFHLASEDTAWVNGGEWTLNITVAEQVVEEKEEAVNVDVPTDANHSALLKVKSANHVKATAGTPILFTVAFENTGANAWNNLALQATDAKFTHPSWEGLKAYSAMQEILPNGLAVATFSFNAPQENGSHQAIFDVVVDGSTVSGGRVTVPVEVTGGSTGTSSNDTTSEPVEESVEYIDEPMIRVGILIVDEETDNEVVITSVYSDFRIANLNGDILAEYEMGDTARAYYLNGTYFYEVEGEMVASSSALRFEPVEAHAPMRIANWDKRITRGTTYADNEFRGVLEMRHNDHKDRVWMINELGMDYYLRGLAETSNSHPDEMNKAQVVAARSYAYFHVVAGGKRSSEFMDLNSTPSDQYYLGYGREKRGTSVVEAVDATRGEVVHYQDAVAITPYYARSNGSTKDWSAVWWGDRPHAKGVPVPCDVGKVQWGHGVGMPQSGATCMANDGATWEEIITYFYTDVEVKRLWE